MDRFNMIACLLVASVATCQAFQYLQPSSLQDYVDDDEPNRMQEEREREDYINYKNKEARIQEYLGRLRDMRLRELQIRQERLEASAGADIAPVVIPPPRHRPHKLSKPAYPPDSPYISSYYSRLNLKPPEFTFSPSLHRPRTDFAVPPTDTLFFQSERDATTEGSSPVHGQLGEYASSTELQLDDVIRTPVSTYDDTREYMVFVAAVAGSSLFVVLMLGFLGLVIYKFQKNVKAAAVVDYPAYGVTGPNRSESTPTGDRKLAQSAQMYHYQITKQQILCMESNQGGAESEADSEEENEQDYTVYECPGLAPTGEMEVKNPLFIDDPTPVLPPTEQPPDKK